MNLQDFARFAVSTVITSRRITSQNKFSRFQTKRAGIFLFLPQHNVKLLSLSSSNKIPYNEIKFVSFNLVKNIYK